MGILKMFKREPTPDQVLVSNLRGACAQYNAAMLAAKKAGLTVMIYSRWSQWGSFSMLMSDYELKVENAFRNTRVEI